VVDITLTPDSTGTVVEFIAKAEHGTLPSSMSVSLPAKDDATIAGGSVTPTGKSLVYSDVVDGLGTAMPAEEIRAGQLSDVRTDGRQVRLSFHVKAVDGRRVVYPVPVSGDMSWTLARYYTEKGSIVCHMDSPRDTRTFTSCPQGARGEVDGRAHSQIRLETLEQ
jgi:hypothetical protein